MGIEQVGTILTALRTVTNEICELLKKDRTTLKERDDVQQKLRFANSMVATYSREKGDEAYYQKMLKLTKKNIELADILVIVSAIEEEHDDCY